MKFHLLLPVLLSLVLFSCSPRIPDRPNIIFIMADDHGYQAISSYGDSLVNTPNLDRLADEGVLFTAGFVTNSICAPSRAVILTGKHSHLNGLTDNSKTFDGSQLTFPKLLKESGYNTAMIGKWHLKSDPTGFNYWNILPGQGSYYNPDFIEMGSRKQIEGYVTDIITDLGIGWIDSVRLDGKPFCLMLHHKATHRTWEPDTKYLSVDDSTEYVLPSTFYDSYAGRLAASQQKMSIISGDMDLVYDLKMNDSAGLIPTRFPFRLDHTARMNDRQKAAWDNYYNRIISDFLKNRPDSDALGEWKFQRYMYDYLACVKSIDDNTGRLLDYLDKTGLSSNTIVIYTSDQGFYLGEHGWFDKRFMYEQSMRTPLLVRFPGSYKIHGRVNDLVQNIDYAPTILDIAGVEIPGEMQGLSFLALLRGEKVKWRDALYYQYYEYPNEHNVKRHYGIRTSRYKLIHFYYDIDSWELYDLKNDPDEMVNLYDDPSYKDIRDKLVFRLDSMRTALKVPVDTTYLDN